MEGWRGRGELDYLPGTGGSRGGDATDGEEEERTSVVEEGEEKREGRMDGRNGRTNG